jgi:hypothetical protein
MLLPPAWTVNLKDTGGHGLEISMFRDDVPGNFLPNRENGSGPIPVMLLSFARRGRHRFAAETRGTATARRNSRFSLDFRMFSLAMRD